MSDRCVECNGREVHKPYCKSAKNPSEPPTSEHKNWCGCETCLAKHAEPPMTRCPNGPKEPPYLRCKLREGHNGPCDWSPAPTPGLLDFEKAHKTVSSQVTRYAAIESDLNAQAAALVEAAVKAAVAENDRMWGLSIIPLGADHIHAVTTRFIALREARDDHR